MTEKTNYVDNKQLYKAICDWKQECRDKGEIVKQNDVIGVAIMAIANGLIKRFNFSNYSQNWKDEMIGDGVEMSIKGLINFDETKYNNPHAYITQACFNAYLQRLKKEKKQTAVKYSYFINHVYDSRDEEMTSIADENFIQDIYDKMNQYESSIKTEKPEVVYEDKLGFLYE